MMEHRNGRSICQLDHVESRYLERVMQLQLDALAIAGAGDCLATFAPEFGLVIAVAESWDRPEHDTHRIGALGL